MKFNYLVTPLVIALIAYIGSRFTTKGLKDNWYRRLKKPSWTPSGKIIGLIWTVLYILIGAGVLIFWNAKFSLMFHYVLAIWLLFNAFLNAYWSKIFFIDHNIVKAFFEMIIMNAITILIVFTVWPISHLGAILLVPYIVWVGIATLITVRIWELN